MPTPMQQTIVTTLGQIADQLAAPNLTDAQKQQLQATSNTLVSLLAQVDALALSAAADKVTAAAAQLQAVMTGAPPGGVDVTKLSFATVALHQAVAAALAAPPAGPAVPAAAGDGGGAAAPAAGGNANGIDCAFDCTGHAAAIRAAGKAFVIRYYRSSNSSYKRLTANEVQALHAANLRVAAVWEWLDKPSHFSMSTGVADGSAAYTEALQAGQPAGTPIYFAVDFDASNAQLGSSIHDYFIGVRQAFSTIGHDQPAYGVGVYGSGLSSRLLLSQNLVSKTWVALSTGWQEYHTFRNWDIRQSPNDGTIAGLDYDCDVAKPGYGSW